MRTMTIPGVNTLVELTDLTAFYESRLSSGATALSPAGLSLLGYMCWPNDSVARDVGAALIRTWLEKGENGPLPPKLRTTQQHWGRIADIVHLHQDIARSGHQQKRGGASAGKAIHLFSQRALGKGTGEARLWTIWKRYKDAGHIITAAIIIAADMRERHQRFPLPLSLQHLLPFRVTLLMPELVIALATTVEHYGLQFSDAEGHSLFDPQTLWRIPPSTGIVPLPMPPRELQSLDLAILRDRRAGNRGRRAAA